MAALSAFTPGSYLGRVVQIFFACKHYGALVPRIGDPTGTDTGTLQRLLDDLYEKPSRRPDPSISIIFNNSHLTRTGEVTPGIAGASNIWRNNFKLQKGYSCYASPAELNSRPFREQSRKLCPHLVTAQEGSLRNAQCALDPESARYRGEDHAKVFRILPGSDEIFVYEPSDVEFYRPLVLANGRRLPIGPLIVALYYDSSLAAGRSEIDLGDFLLDFDFSPAEFAAYFDDNINLPEHQALNADFPGLISWTPIPIGLPLAPAALPIAAPGQAAPPVPAPVLPAIPQPGPRRARRIAAIGGIALPAASPPAGSHWWDAEQAVRQILEADGWAVVDMSRFGVGYDLLARKAAATLHIEVKSSAGKCSPVLTENEYIEARRLRQTYILAIVENYSPTASVTVRWVADPARLALSARRVLNYGVARSQWVPKSTEKPDQ